MLMSRRGMDADADSGAVSGSSSGAAASVASGSSDSGEIVCSSPIINRYGAIWE